MNSKSMRFSFKPLTVTRGSFRTKREERMDINKDEKSLDNRCAALVSRGPRAPRAEQNCKPFMGKELRLMSLLSMARGAQVSRAARPALSAVEGWVNLPFSRPVHRALSGSHSRGQKLET